MIRVSFVDGNFGVWGFRETVAFTYPTYSDQVPSRNLILEVSVSSEIFDCTDTKFEKPLRKKPDLYNYGPITENFGGFRSPELRNSEPGRIFAPKDLSYDPIYDFHSAFGIDVYDAYNVGEMIRITIDGTTYLQKVEGSSTRGTIDATRITTPQNVQGVSATDDFKKTGKKWTLPGIIKGRVDGSDKALVMGQLVGMPILPKTTYSYVYTYMKCGAEKDWKGSATFASAIQTASLDLTRPAGGLAAFAARDEILLASLVGDLNSGVRTPSALSASLDYQALAASPNAGAKAAARLPQASPLEAFVLSSLLGSVGNTDHLRPLLESMGNAGDTRRVSSTANGLGSESFPLDEVVRDSSLAILRRADSGGAEVSLLGDFRNMEERFRRLSAPTPAIGSEGTVQG